jgi:demethylmenaquinone methyltransferase/2-methoxy-6-polyprenyl-1,4-benzoquinol methylase
MLKTPAVLTPSASPLPNQLVQSPIPTMTDYYKNAEEKDKFISDIFNNTASDYDRMERLLGMGSGSWYRGQALLRAGLSVGQSVIDVAVGTGLVAREAVRIVKDPSLVVGVDPSAGMLNSAKVPEGVRLVQGSAESIPLPDASFDFLSMGYALRHIPDLTKAFNEFYRVVKPGARICILEITPPKNRIAKNLVKIYMKNLVPTFGRFFNLSGDTATLWRYYWDSIEACVPAESVIATLEAAGFKSVERVVMQGIFSEYRAIK